MLIQIKLLSDAIFGNGQSIPGGEDISILCDDKGFPYYKGSTFKGIFREELIRLLEWKGIDRAEINNTVDELLGKAGDDGNLNGTAVFSDFVIPYAVREAILKEIGASAERVKDCLTNIRAFTSIDEDGTAKDGSLRMARCVDEGLTFTGTIDCSKEQEPLIRETLSMIKWLGTMRNRGFGKVKITSLGA